MLLLLEKRRALFFLVIPLAIIFFIICLMLGFDQKQAVLSWHIADKTFIIDPGHGGIFPGKVSADGTEEKDINLAIANCLNELFAESGSVTIMTRTSDEDLVPADKNDAKLILRQRADLEARASIATASGADFYISIHCNSSPSSTWSGAQTFFAPDNPESAQLAQFIQQSLIKQLGNTDRQAIERKDTYLFEHLEIPSVIVECGFLSNPQETNLLRDPAYQHKIAYAIYCGISDYLDSLEA